MSKIGYACICLSLGDKVSTNRSMVKKTFNQRGISYASELAYSNVTDLLHIIKWNVANNVKLFRLSSDMFPWSSEYNITDLDGFHAIKQILYKCGELANRHNIRITSHPGPFDVLCSPNESVVTKTIKDLETHGEIFDLMGLELSPYNKINIHCNGVYGDKLASMDRFCANFQRLSNSVKTRLTVENDDKASMYSVSDLMYIHEKIGIPIVFDYHHHQFCTGGLTEEQALNLAVTTWPKSITPIVHYSESKSLHENNPAIKPQAHSDIIKSLPNTYGLDVDIMVESKHKDLAILPFVALNSVCEYSGLIKTDIY